MFLLILEGIVLLVCIVAIAAAIGYSIAWLIVSFIKWGSEQNV